MATYFDLAVTEKAVSALSTVFITGLPHQEPSDSARVSFDRLYVFWVSVTGFLVSEPTLFNYLSSLTAFVRA